MAKPTLNFVWFGPTKFNQGGQDIVGPETIDQNFKAHPESNIPPNPMVFWCQDAYREQYAAYFAKKGIAIEVQSIEEYLASCQIEQENAAIILQHFREIILDPNRNRVLDRVYMKDMFFNFILATQGGYVLDTSVYANQDAPVNFRDYPTFMFPFVADRGDSAAALEVWMQYAPPSDLRRAKQCLDRYLELYKETMDSVEFSSSLYSKYHHDSIGYIAVGALALRSDLSDVVSIDDFQSDTCQVWPCLISELSPEVMVPGISVTKEYYRSHRADQEAQGYSASHWHVLTGETERLIFDLDHGVPVDTESSPQNIPILVYNAEHETLLHVAMRYSDEERVRECAELLLEKGADPNKVHTITYLNEHPVVTRQESPLTYAIDSKSSEAMELLFRCSRHPVQVDQVLNNQSPLLQAVEHKMDITLLLQHGADPNQSWPRQKITPLARACITKQIKSIGQLLAAGADPNARYVRRDFLEKKIISETPLHIALMKSDAKALQLLLESGADPLAVVEHQSEEKTIRISAEELATSKECKALLAVAIQKQRKSTSSSLSHASSSFGLFDPATASTGNKPDSSEPDTVSGLILKKK